MRLICPNCGAQYEVDDSVIPDAGRDVQCSACGQTWFQPGVRAQEEAQQAKDAEDIPGAAEWDAFSAPESAEPETTAEAPAETVETAEASVVEPDIAMASDGADKSESEDTPDSEDGTKSQDAEHDEDADEEEEEPAPAADGSRRMLDDSLLAILREEAERETRARRIEGSSLETQTDLGLTPLPAALAARAAAKAAPVDAETEAEADDTTRDARLRPDPTDAHTREGARRDRLPDIEVINSTLRATSERGSADAAHDAPETRARRRAGFRIGFFSVITVAALAAGVYSFAPRISLALPVLEPTLARYVAAVDTGRIWLDAQMRSVIERLQSES
ncbi:zinc-ribbon domain-containing protein [Phaeovulum sp.]|uniref:zinc-ribbon domain-containing protein n=1 Tax=Phaeovulum sp. TaxID=2934796 RepID=UPI00356B3F67